MFRFLIMFFGVVTSFGLVSSAQAGQSSYDSSIVNPVVRAVYFHADWCGACKAIDPKLEQVKAESRALPVQHVTLDFTDPKTSWDQAGNLAIDLDVTSTFNAYAGSTGLIVLVAADTGEQIDCVTRMHSTDAMIQSFKSAIVRTQNTPPGSRATGSVFCPPARAARN